jgi:tripartite-type tricarboxylate transporter receptor subunit TctC
MIFEVMETGMAKRMMTGMMAALGAMTAAAIVAASPVAAQTPEQFYKGKTMTFVIGSGTGGGYDMVGRMLAQHMGAHIPGKPVIVVKNMPGSSSVRAAEWFGSVAARDGSVIGMFQPTVIGNKLVEGDAAKYEPEKFNWLGRISTSNQFGMVWFDAPATTIEDAKKREVILAANSATGTGAIVPWALNRLIGTKFRVVKGYPGAAEVGLAVERGEAKGMGSTSWDYMETKPWISEGKVKFLYTISLQRDPKIPDVPTIVELAKNEEDRSIFKLLSVASTIGRSPAAAPGTPADRVAALRKAFDDTMKDPAFLADAKRRTVELEYGSGEEIAKQVSEIIAMPKSVVARYNEVTQPMD